VIVQGKKILLLVGVALLFIGAAVFFSVPSAQSISSALDHTIIKDLSFRKATPEQACLRVMNQFLEQHPELRKVRLTYYPSSAGIRLEQARTRWIVLQMPGSPPTAPEWYYPITAELGEIPASEAFSYVTTVAGLTYVVRPGTICIYSPTTPPPPALRDRFDSVLLGSAHSSVKDGRKEIRKGGHSL